MKEAGFVVNAAVGDLRGLAVVSGRGGVFVELGFVLRDALQDVLGEEEGHFAAALVMADVVFGRVAGDDVGEGGFEEEEALGRASTR